MEPSPVTRSVWFSATYQYLLTDALAPAQQHGFGVAGSYEFHVKPRFLIGLPLAYRAYPGEGWAHQIGYGVTLRHFFSDRWPHGRKVYPYLGYGLLQQQTFAPGKSGAAISHDTRLGMGLVLGHLGLPLFVEVAAHIARLQYFDVEPTWVPYLNLNVGGILRF